MSMPSRHKQNILESLKAILAIIALILVFIIVLTGLVLVERLVLA